MIKIMAGGGHPRYNGVNPNDFGELGVPASPLMPGQALEKLVMDMLDVQKTISADCLVQEVVEHHPETVLVFVRHGLQCVGCTISPFHTIADSAREHAVALEALLGALNDAVAGRGPS